MSIFKSKKLVLITAVYWFLLVYIVAALVWWFISLEQQNKQMTTIRLQELVPADKGYPEKKSNIEDENRRKTAQYIGEGITFFALIILGAVFVYRATRKQFRLSQQQQNFMMAVTHELKTPIAVARLNLETLQRHQLDEAHRRRLLSTTLLETNRLNTLCNNILLASQLDAGAYKVVFSEVDLSKIVTESVADFSNRFPQRQIINEVRSGLVVEGEELLLQLLVNNIIENGLKYSPAAKPITVSLGEKHGVIKFCVKDEGPGIEDREKKKIFDKFYRVGNESTRLAKGTGLGLFLSKKIAEDHGADITVGNNQPNGSIFTVSFKR